MTQVIHFPWYYFHSASQFTIQYISKNAWFSIESIPKKEVKKKEKKKREFNGECEEKEKCVNACA